MNFNAISPDLIGNLRLRNDHPDPASRIAMISLPLPPGQATPLGLRGFTTQTQTVGWWPESAAGRRGVPRRQLMFALAQAPLPAEFGLAPAPTAPTRYAGPEASVQVVSRKSTGIVLSEVNEVVFEQGDRRLALRLGLRHGGEFKWWEWLRLEELWSGPVCKAIRIGGFIEVEHFPDSHFAGRHAIACAPAVHMHNWLHAEVFAILFANGVVQLTCRHVNNHLFDQGRDLHDVLPVIAFSGTPGAALNETLDGARTRFDLGGVSLNLDEASTLVSPERPGALRSDGDLVIYQPYQGVEIRGDSFKRKRDDGYICKAADNVMPRGVARSVRFAIGLGAAAPVVTRLAAPDWWYAVARDIWPDGVLPVHDDADALIDRQRAQLLDRARQPMRAFDNSIMIPGGWEGETPFATLLNYYQTGDRRFFDIALTDAYFMADVGFDHATETIRMDGYPFGAVAPPLYRTVGMTFGYLETGDPYLLDCAESAAVRFYWIDRHNWPRRSYGRDAMSLRSLIFLWDYTGKEDYLGMAREALGRLIACQRPDGSYADQGGTVGLHGTSNDIIKVWMSMMANAPVIDYLERRPDDAELFAALRRTADFVLKAQREQDGVYFWAYEYRYGDNPGNGHEMTLDPVNYLRHPTRRMVGGYKARFLSFVTRRTGDTAYVEAWERYFATNCIAPTPTSVLPEARYVSQYLPYAQAHRWNARLDGATLHLTPILTARNDRLEGEIVTPRGNLRVVCVREKSGVTVHAHGAAPYKLAVHLPGQSQPVIIDRVAEPVPAGARG